MEESSDVAEERASSKDLSSEIANFALNGKQREVLSYPICFLVKEQAKSSIAIQELQSRLCRVETVQDDVIDAIIEIRNHLSDSRSYGSTQHSTTNHSLSLNRSPHTIFPKFNEIAKSNTTNVPCAAETSVEVPQAVLKSRPCSLKECGSMSNDYGRLQASALVSEPHQKNFYFAKSKDSALESDKQDSGLDSDCREQHDNNPSLVKNNPLIHNPEGNDELLQLLDEIGHRSVLLQKQIAVTDEFPAENTKDVPSCSHTQSEGRPSVSDDQASADHETSNSDFTRQKLTSTTIFEDRQLNPEAKVPIFVNHNDIFRLFDAKASHNSPGRKFPNGIDSAAVSSILKETNIMDLQKKALLYLLDNTVLLNKLKESEQALECRRTEGDKMETTLREEARLLMMENRELRISLDERRLETNSLKAHVVMLEKLLQSLNSENQELNWHLGETLNLNQTRSVNPQNHSKFENSPDLPKSVRKSPSSVQQTLHKSVHCVKSKLLSNNSSFLDITVDDDLDESRSNLPRQMSLRTSNRPIYSSTPMLTFKKQKEQHSVVPSDLSPVDFQSVKKCLQSSYDSENVENASQFPQSKRAFNKTFSEGYDEIRNRKFQPNTSAGRNIPLEGLDKFPFNTILEKLKANSECRLSKSASAKDNHLTGDREAISNPRLKKTNDVEVLGVKEGSPHVNPDVALQRRKGRDIQQRIQNILDRIVQSEEGS